MAAGPNGDRRPRPAREARLIDRVLDFPYRRLFGLKGCLVIAVCVLAVLGVRFVTGIATVTLDPTTCRLAGLNVVYKPFHQQRILENTQQALQRQIGEKQTALWAVRAGRDPFAPKDAAITAARTIDRDKFFWRSYAANLEKEIQAIGDCLRKLPDYRFD